MKGLLTYPQWKDHAITIYCSNHHCRETIVIDEREISGLVICSKECGAAVRRELLQLEVKQQ